MERELFIMKNQIVIPTGYMESGSSAITDLLSEIDGYKVDNGIYEYILMHCPDGVFDLEDKLLYGNNCIRSDEAIHRFLECMSELYQKINYWPGGYKKKLSKHYMEHCYDFIERLEPIELKETYWYFQENPDSIWMHILSIFRRSIRKLGIRNRLTANAPLRYRNMRVVIPQKEKFFYEARSFLTDIFNDLGYVQKNLVLDQFLLPHNLFRIKDYFDGSLRVFVVERDPRDVFIANKYFLKKEGIPVPYPLDAEEFCKMYKAVRKSEKMIADRRILRLHFEDLVYAYEKTLPAIYSFLGVGAEKHRHKKTRFDPDVSIKNTMLFKKLPSIGKEVYTIEKGLKDYLYDFPENTVDHL